MQKVIILKGLPGSGKTTWAKELLASDPTYKRINKDDLRAMLDNGKWSKEREKLVVDLRDKILTHCLVNGNSVIIDDTNLVLKHETTIREICVPFPMVDVEVKLFDTPLQECIKRDLTRPKPVGEKVIYQMWEKHLKPKPRAKDVNLPSCIIVDIDGTLAKMNGRDPHDYDRVGEDLSNQPIVELVRDMNRSGDTGNHYIIIVSARQSGCRAATERWLQDHGITYEELLMRVEGDTRRDNIVKQEILHRDILPKYNVEFVLDDRDRVVEMWRAEGLTCLQVDFGNF